MTSTASPARLAANRANARRSTGPRTPEGKAVSATNSTTHGLLAAQPLIRGEDPALLEALTNHLRAEMRPATAYQEILVETIVGLLWRLRRVERVEAALYDAGLSAPVLKALGASGDGSAALGLAFAGQAPAFAALSRIEVTLVNRLRRAVDELGEVQAAREARSRTLVVVTPTRADGFVSRSGHPQDAPRGLPGPSSEAPERPSDRYRERQLPEVIERGERR